ncbi:MAG: hypothetical protein WBB28_05470 [Crinalium sp.]
MSDRQSSLATAVDDREQVFPWVSWWEQMPGHCFQHLSYNPQNGFKKLP